eukprot:CAMPEP_0115716340 /NCGR_PEP_ID=MMETSP0272-20121206/76272_1 /TAXON_ID=71861 /ORGANISM="Scrippsiella trochoidea, Strain CCMP3099" /LENGTH=171 /DNA_ID=CAMNT_0003158649 /DNA_START=89 /DNA_END=603 /DNA_ORIENTATION=-
MAKSSTRPLREVKLLLLVACGAYLVSYLMELAGLANVRAGGKKEVAPVIPGVSAGTSQQKSPKAPQQRNSGGVKASRVSAWSIKAWSVNARSIEACSVKVWRKKACGVEICSVKACAIKAHSRSEEDEVMHLLTTSTSGFSPCAIADRHDGSIGSDVRTARADIGKVEAAV